MTSTIKVNNIQNQCGANIINESANTITIGASGDTISLAAGASQTGFGRTGTVDWDTTAKTASFTAVSGTGYFVNTTSGAITVTMPASPSAGDIVALSDYAGTWGTNNVNLSSAIYNGSTGTPALSTNKQTAFLVYVDGTKGWITTNESTTRISGFSGITATGGTVTTCGDYKIHTFTSPGTFCVSALSPSSPNNVVDYLVIGGGGGGGACRGGGGGAGGYRESSGAASGCYTRSPLGACVSALPVSVTGYPITIGGGGAGSPGRCGPDAVNGSNSVFSTITSAGGGYGAKNFPGKGNGGPGASGGGGVRECGTGTGGTGNTPPVSPPQGNPGGPANGSNSCAAGGGGGATAAGKAGDDPAPIVGDGGAGGTSSINGTPTGRAGGGGGGPGGGPAGSGVDGGGDGGAANPGTANTGGGGGGGAAPSAAGNGGSGVVIIRYKYQ